MASDAEAIIRNACAIALKMKVCEWPHCFCLTDRGVRADRVLAALLAAARAEERAAWMACALKSRRPGHEHEYAGWDVTALNRQRVAAEKDTAAIRGGSHG